MLIENLTTLRDQFKLLGGGWQFYDFILTYATFYPGAPLPKQYVRRLPRQCFYNARCLVRRSKNLEYCEGIAMRLDRIGLPVHHAWALKDGKVIDPTWGNPENCEYLGIVFDRKHLIHSLRYSGQLFNQYGAVRQDAFEAVKERTR
jgi:hypothetical protein